MRRTVFAMIALVALSGSAAASEIEIEIDNFTAQRGISEVVFRATNNTDKDVSSVYIDCVFMTEDERAIDIGRAVIRTIPRGETKFEKAAITTTDGVAKALCNVASFR